MGQEKVRVLSSLMSIRQTQCLGKECRRSVFDCSDHRQLLTLTIDSVIIIVIDCNLTSSLTTMAFTDHSLTDILMIRVLALYSQGTWNGSQCFCADSPADRKLSIWLKGLLGLEVATKSALVAYISWLEDRKNRFSDFGIQAKGSLSHTSYFDERSHCLFTK